MSLPRLSAADFPQPSISPLTIGQLFMQSFQQATDMVRQREADDMQAQKFQMQQEQHQLSMEDAAWERENLRPLQLQAERLRLLQSRRQLEYQRANTARLEAQTTTELLKQRSMADVEDGFTRQIADIGNALLTYEGKQAAPASTPEPLPPGTDSPNPPLDMSRPTAGDTRLPTAPATREPALPADAGGGVNPANPLLPPAEGGTAPTAPTPAAPPAPDLAGPPDASPIFAKLEEARKSIDLTTAPNSRDRAQKLAALEDARRLVFSRPGMTQAFESWQTAQTAAAQRKQVETLATQMEEARALGVPLNLPPSVKLEGGKLLLAKTNQPLSLNQALMVERMAFQPAPASTYDPAKDKELQAALTIVRTHQRPDYQASLTTPEEKAKAKQEFEKAQAQLQVLATTSPERARIIMAATAPPPKADDPAAAKAEADAKAKAEADAKAKAEADAKTTWLAPAERAAAAAKAKADADTATTWTAAKETYTSGISAADLEGAAQATAEGRLVKTGETRQHTRLSISGPGPVPTFGVPEPVTGSPARALLVEQGINPDAKQKIGDQEFTLEQIVTERLKEIATEKGFGKPGKDSTPAHSVTVNGKVYSFPTAEKLAEFKTRAGI